MNRALNKTLASLPNDTRVFVRPTTIIANLCCLPIWRLC